MSATPSACPTSPCPCTAPILRACSRILVAWLCSAAMVVSRLLLLFKSTHCRKVSGPRRSARVGARLLIVTHTVIIPVRPCQTDHYQQRGRLARRPDILLANDVFKRHDPPYRPGTSQ